MYTDFFGLREEPFSITADPSLFYPSWLHGEALDNIIYGIEERKGLIVLTGEIGTGKTTLCRTALYELGSNTKTALVLNPNLPTLQLVKSFVKDLGIPFDPKDNKFELVKSLNNYLLEQTSQGNNVALIIDEAQNLGNTQLEEIRLLSNLETEKEKLIQIVLCGQPELHDKLQCRSLRQLNQRIVIRLHLTPLKRPDIEEYILHRLSKCRKDPVEDIKLNFSDEAFDLIFRYSKGTPRLVNILCDRVLLAAFSIDTYDITKAIVNKCTDELESLSSRFDEEIEEALQSNQTTQSH